MSTLSRQVVSVVRRHAVLAGFACMVVGALMIVDGVASGRRFRRFEHARQASATVTSMVEASSVPPRWDVGLAWPDKGVGAREVVRVGPRRARTLHTGGAVDILISEAESRAVILAADRPREKPVDLGLVAATPLVFVGLAVAGCGLALALAGARFTRAPVRSRTRPPDAVA
jgi:hypothetical protein